MSQAECPTSKVQERDDFQTLRLYDIFSSDLMNRGAFDIFQRLQHALGQRGMGMNHPGCLCRCHSHLHRQRRFMNQISRMGPDNMRTQNLTLKNPVISPVACAFPSAAYRNRPTFTP